MSGFTEVEENIAKSPNGFESACYGLLVAATAVALLPLSA